MWKNSFHWSLWLLSHFVNCSTDFKLASISWPTMTCDKTAQFHSWFYDPVWPILWPCVTYILWPYDLTTILWPNLFYDPMWPILWPCDLFILWPCVTWLICCMTLCDLTYLTKNGPCWLEIRTHSRMDWWRYCKTRRHHVWHKCFYFLIFYLTPNAEQ